MSQPAAAEKARRVVLVGASIGRAWHFERLNERTTIPGYRFEYIGEYAFDKGPAIQKILGGPKPDVVMIKECGSYFPGRAEGYEARVSGWVAQLRAAGIQPVLVTVPPVAEPKSALTRLKNFVKNLIGRTTALEGITQYNDWLKRYAQQEGIPVFDAEAQLRRSDTERWLRDEYDKGDGLHLNETAYRVLDRGFARFMVDWKPAPRTAVRIPSPL